MTSATPPSSKSFEQIDPNNLPRPRSAASQHGDIAALLIQRLPRIHRNKVEHHREHRRREREEQHLQLQALRSEFTEQLGERNLHARILQMLIQLDI